MSVEAAVATFAFVLLFVGAFLAMAETAFSRIERFRVQALMEDKRRGAAALAHITDDPDKFSGYLNSVLLTLLATQIAMATSVAYLLLRYVDGPLFVLAVTVEVFLIYVVAEAMPKTWAILHTERAALIVAPVIAGLSRILPMRFVTQPLIWMANVLLPGKGLKQGPFVFEQQILALADTAAREKAIHHDEHRLIHSVIEFGTTIAREVMVPRTDMVAIAATSTLGQAIEVALDKGFSRLPVHGGESDEINGILFTKDLMRAVRDGQDHLPVSALVRPAKYIPETKRVAELLAEMQAEKTHMAVVVDEYGTVVGIVTLEDLVEEVVGEITDEYDADQLPAFEVIAENEWLIDARMQIDDFYSATGVRLPHGDWDTVGGLLINAFGRVPSKGESTEVDDLRITAEAISGRRVLRARIVRMSPSEETGEVQSVEA